MATFRKQNSGYRAEVARKGRRKSKVLPTLQQAKDWAARAEFEILHSDKVAAQTPFGDVLDRYAREVSPAKKGHRWEVVRLEKIQRDKIACISLGELNPKDLADYRDRRLREVTGASVRRRNGSAVFCVQCGTKRVGPDVRKSTSGCSQAAPVCGQRQAAFS